MMKPLLLRGICGIVLIVALASLSIRSAAADAPVTKRFAVRLTITGSQDGKLATIGQPELLVEDGRQASVLLGGTINVDAGKPEEIPLGVQVTVTVHSIAGGKLRLLLHLTQSDRDLRQQPDVVVRESGVRSITEITPGDTFTVVLDGGVSMKGSVTTLPQN